MQGQGIFRAVPSKHALEIAHHFILVICTKEHASGPAVQLVVVEACPAYCRSVHNGRHGGEVVQQHLVEQGLIAILQQHCSITTLLDRLESGSTDE